MSCSSRARTERIGKLLLLTFAVTWSLWAVVLRAASTAREPSHVSPLLALGGPLFLIGVFAPGLVAVAATAIDEGRPAVVALLRRIAHWRVGLRFYAFALLLMPLTRFVVAVVYRALVGRWPHFGDTHLLVLVLSTIFSTLGQAGEEVGWRGYLLARLTERTGQRCSSCRESAGCPDQLASRGTRPRLSPLAPRGRQGAGPGLFLLIHPLLAFAFVFTIRGSTRTVRR